MRFIGLFLLSFFLTFFFFRSDHRPLTSLKEIWVWNKSGNFGTASSKVGEDPRKVLNGYRLPNGSYFSFASGKTKEIQEPNRLEYPLLAEGFLEYEKIGDEVHFFTQSGELFWSKPINSYPRAGLFAAPVLYLAGDSNTVFLLDQSGNSAGKGEVNGRFLVDYSFDRAGNGVFVLFSGGEMYRLDATGKEIYRLDLGSSTEQQFFKSATLSPNGKSVAIHYTKNQKDFLQVLDEKGESLVVISLPKVYPHILYFALSNDLHLLLNAPDKTYFFFKDKLIREWEKNETNQTYQVSFATKDAFLFESDGFLVFLDESGNELKRKPISKNEKPIRLFPSKTDNQFYLETKEDIFQFTVF